MSVQEGGWLAQGSPLSRSEGDPCREVAVAAWCGGSEPERVEGSSYRGPARGGGACWGRGGTSAWAKGDESARWVRTQCLGGRRVTEGEWQWQR